ncbi:MAG: glycogen synthase GlgA [Ignavibacteriales bacterium]|nr:glycogen synthase GlgA [Ignavibacteriales bacterium]HPO55809.1 glycogen synthase GlgA [Ignavibacteriaceae bacterium]
MTNNKQLKVLFVTPELVPFVKVGGVADVSSALPKMLAELGCEVRVVVPKYGAVDNRKFKIHDVVRLKDIPITIGDKDYTFSLKSSFLPSPKVRVQIYFLDNELYFGSRKSIYGDALSGEDYPDNDMRFAFFSHAIFELIEKLGWQPDIIHCNDWQTGLVPAYFKALKKRNPASETIKILYTIHNFSNQGIFGKGTLKGLGLPDSMINENGILHGNKVNYMKAGIQFADFVNTVSPGYAKEVMANKVISSGLDELLKKKKKKFAGLINGIDESDWNPKTDKFIPKRYVLKSIDEKLENKKALIERFDLEGDLNEPVIGIISRLTEEKGIDLFVDSFDKLAKMKVKFVVLGAGQKIYHTKLEKLHKQYPHKLGLLLGFDNELAHLIEAGADMLLMPSKYEPCGLNQMYSLVYGTIPIVRKTGGLADTVSQFDSAKGTGNGFVFEKYTAGDMIKSITSAMKIFEDKGTWNKIIANGMQSDFSWKSSARGYVELYQNILNQ